MSKNPERDKRLLDSARELFAKHGPKFRVDQLAKAARVSATLAGPFRKRFLAERQAENAAAQVRSLTPSAPALARPEAADLVADLMKLAASSQAQVTSLIDVVNKLLSRVPELGDLKNLPRDKDSPSIAPSASELSELDITQEAAKLSEVESPSLEQGMMVDSHHESQSTVPKEGTPHCLEGPGEPSPPTSRSLELPRPVRPKNQLAFDFNTKIPAATGTEPTKKSRSRPPPPAEPPPVRVSQKPDITPTSPSGPRSRRPAHEVQTSILIQAAREVVAEAKEPLSSYEIHRRLPADAQALCSQGYLKTLLRKAPSLHFEELDGKFWLTLPGPEHRLLPLWKVAVEATVRMLMDETSPMTPDDIHSHLPHEVADVLSVEALSKALKLQASQDQTFRQTAHGRWLLKINAGPKLLDNQYGKPGENLPSLSMEVEKILAESAWSMTAAQIHRLLSADLRDVFDPNHFTRYLKKLPEAVFVRDDDKLWSLATSPQRGRPPKVQEAKSKRAVNQEETKTAIDAAVQFLRATRRTMTVDELFIETAPSIGRKRFGKGMNQRRKSMKELERVDAGLYRFNPAK
jgi:hypothetical protein